MKCLRKCNNKLRKLMRKKNVKREKDRVGGK